MNKENNLKKIINTKNKINEKGNLLFIIALAIIASVVILPILMHLFQPLDILVRIILAFTIIATVRGYLGNGVLTIIVSGILIYFLVIKWWWVASPIWLFTIFLSLNIFGMIVWGIGTTLRPR